MSITYTASPIYNASIFLIEIENLIQGGIDGNDNKAIQQLAQTTNYLQKFKGNIIMGDSEPIGSYSLTIDNNSSSNVLYFNTINGSWYKPVTSGSYVSSWTNITKDVVLNVAGLELNDNGSDVKFAKLSYDSVSEIIRIQKENGDYINLRLGNIKPNTLDQSSSLKTFVVDDELIVSDHVVTPAQNTSASFGVKRFDGLSRNDALIYWNEDIYSWELKWGSSDTGNGLININANNYFIKGRRVSIIQNLIISDQASFDLWFNKAPDGGVTYINDSIYPGVTFPFYAHVKHGTYIMKNYIIIQKSNFRLECDTGAVLIPDTSIINGDSFIFVDNSSSQTGMSIPTPDDRYENIVLDLNFDLDAEYNDSILSITNSFNSTFKLKIKNGSCDVLVKGFYDYNNRVEILQDSSFVLSKPLQSITACIVSGTCNADPLTIENCSSIIFNGIFNYNAEILQGTFGAGLGSWQLEASPSQFPFRVL